MEYEVSFARRAVSQLELVTDEKTRMRIHSRIAALATEPRPPGCEKLKGDSSSKAWRIRIGDYRVLYEISDEPKSIIVFRVLHRRDAYRP